MKSILKKAGYFLLAAGLFAPVGGSFAGRISPKSARLVPGAWLKVKGEFGEGNIFKAREIEISDKRRASIKGPLDSVDVGKGELRFGPLVLRLDTRTRIEDDNGEKLALADFHAGQRAKLSLDLETPGTFRVRRLRLLAASSASRRIEGPIQIIHGQEGNGVRFTLLGVEVEAGARTEWSGIIPPRNILSDEDFRPGKGIRIGKIGWLTGEVRFDYKDERNRDLTDALDRDVSKQRYRTELELTFPSTRHLSGMAQIKAQDERDVRDQADRFDGQSDLTLGRTYLYLTDVLTSHGSIQVGRSRFEDRRDWLFNHDLDAVRLLFDFHKIRLEASVSEALVSPEEDQDDIINTLFSVNLYPNSDNLLSVYSFNRSDSFTESNGSERDFSPRYLGFRANGEIGDQLSYWLEAARARGSVDGIDLRGSAFDAGFTWVFSLPWKPSITLGYAVGSGDPDPFDQVDETFFQSGLHRNNGKWNGVTNFRYYGEVLRPDLSNLRIETYGIGLRPRRKTSIDLIFHRYRLDEPSSSLVQSKIENRRLNFVDLDVGEEWDLVIGFEEFKHFEFELDLGTFLPGDAFLGDTDPSIAVRLKTKFVF